MHQEQVSMYTDLQKYRDELKRAEDRMDRARTDSEYDANREIANYAARQVEAILGRLHKW